MKQVTPELKDSPPDSPAPKKRADSARIYIERPILTWLEEKKRAYEEETFLKVPLSTVVRQLLSEMMRAEMDERDRQEREGRKK